MLHQNNRAANAYRQPAPSQIEAPAEFKYHLEDVEFQSEEGLTLRGWLIEGPQTGTVILLHGYGSNRLSNLWHAERLAAADLTVLLYDQRGSGESAVTQRSYGWQDPVDVLAAVDFLRSRPGGADERIGVAGCSIGGQIALQAAASDPRLEAVWADGPSLVRAADLPQPYSWASLLAKASTHVFDWIFAAKLGMFPPAPLIEQLPALEGRPVQFIAGGTAANALGAESVLVGNYFHYAGSAADLWVIEQAVHCDGPMVVPDEYAGRLVSFFERSLLP